MPYPLGHGGVVIYFPSGTALQTQKNMGNASFDLCLHCVYTVGEVRQFRDNHDIDNDCVHQMKSKLSLSELNIHPQCRSQNAEKVTHIKGRLQHQAMILFHCAPFQIGTSLKGKNLLPEGANLSFMSSSL